MSRRFVPARLIATVAVTAAATLGAAALAAPTALAAGPSWMSGAYTGNADISALHAFTTWRDAPAGIVTDYFDQSSWANMESDASWATAEWAQAGQRVAWSVPMLPATGGYTLAAGAAGDYNSYFKQLAETLVTNNEGSSILRIGWEFNGNWMPWSAGSDPSAYAEYFRQIVDTMRSVPGQHFSFDWCVSNDISDTDVAAAYPGNAYVDYIGDDVYDWDYSSHSASARWNYLVNGPDGLAWQASFAAAHGKQLSFPEWGLAWLSNGWGGGDDTLYIQKMYGWFSSHNVGYESYFDINDSSDEVHALTSSRFGSAAALYRKLFSGAAGATPAPPVASGGSGSNGSGGGHGLSGSVGQLGKAVHQAAARQSGTLTPVVRTAATRVSHRSASAATRPVATKSTRGSASGSATGSAAASGHAPAAARTARRSARTGGATVLRATTRVSARAEAPMRTLHATAASAAAAVTAATAAGTPGNSVSASGPASAPAGNAGLAAFGLVAAAGAATGLSRRRRRGCASS